jgi:hypothetical protein
VPIYSGHFYFYFCFWFLPNKPNHHVGQSGALALQTLLSPISIMCPITKWILMDSAIVSPPSGPAPPA